MSDPLDEFREKCKAEIAALKYQLDEIDAPPGTAITDALREKQQVIKDQIRVLEEFL